MSSHFVILVCQIGSQEVTSFLGSNFFLNSDHFILFFLNLFIESLMYKFKKRIVLAPTEQLSVQQISIFQIFMKLLPKMSDILTKVGCRMKWVKQSICNMNQWDTDVINTVKFECSTCILEDVHVYVLMYVQQIQQHKLWPVAC